MSAHPHVRAPAHTVCAARVDGHARAGKLCCTGGQACWWGLGQEGGCSGCSSAASWCCCLGCCMPVGQAGALGQQRQADQQYPWQPDRAFCLYLAGVHDFDAVTVGQSGTSKADHWLAVWWTGSCLQASRQGTLMCWLTWLSVSQHLHAGAAGACVE